MSLKHENKPITCDAATLIIIRQNETQKPQHCKILMGRRNKKHIFMPDVFVFPGGRVDRSDSKIIPATDLHPDTMAKLLEQMRGKPSKNRARAIAMAAIRETFEETGLQIGKQIDQKIDQKIGKDVKSKIHKIHAKSNWAAFCHNNIRPNLDPLILIARAITPPGQKRRFDARFFAIDAKYVLNLDHPEKSGDELIDTQWVSFEQARDLKTHYVTEKVLALLETILQRPNALQKQDNIYFQYKKYNKWIRQTL